MAGLLRSWRQPHANVVTATSTHPHALTHMRTPSTLTSRRTSVGPAHRRAVLATMHDEEERAAAASWALVHLRDSQAPIRVQVGAARTEGEMGWRIPIGRVPEHQVGPYQSEQRRAWEENVTTYLSELILPLVQPYIVVPEAHAFVGVTMSHPGTPKAIISILTCGLPPRVSMAVEGQLRQGVTVTVMTGAPITLTCHMQPGCEPSGSITVIMSGPELPRQTGAVAAILQAVGYPASVKVLQEFWGATKVPGIGDHHTVVAHITPPVDDFCLDLLPSRIPSMGGSNTFIKLSVSSRKLLLLGTGLDGNEGRTATGPTPSQPCNTWLVCVVHIYL